MRCTFHLNADVGWEQRGPTDPGGTSETDDNVGSNGKSQCTNALFVSKSVFTNVVRKYGYSLKKKIAPSC